MGNACPGSSSSDALVHDSQVASTKDTAKASAQPAAFAPTKVSAPPSPIASFLLITLESARDLPAKDGPLLKADPFVIVTFGSTATRSHTQFNTLSPTWNESILVTVTADDMQHPGHVIRFSLYDQDLSTKNDYIGRCDLPLSDFLAKESESMELKLIPNAKVGETPGSGFVGFLKIKFACSPIGIVKRRAVSDMFSRFDRDGNGRLDAAEFAQFQSSLSTAGSSVFGRVDQNKDGMVDIAEVLSCVEQLIPDEVVADYFVKEANNARSLLIHHSGQQGTALTEEQAGRGWFVSMTEWVSRDKYGAGLHVGRKADHIVVYNRAKGLLEEETIDPALAFSMKALYQTYYAIFARIYMFVHIM